MSSMYTVTIRGGRAFVKSNGKDKPEQEIETLAPYLGSIIELDEGTKFEDLWKFIEIDADIFSVVFNDQLAGHEVAAFASQFAKPGRSGEEEIDPDNHIARLEVGWAAESDTYKGAVSFYIGADFGGRGPQKAMDGTTFDGGWGVDFMPINDLRGYSFVLNKAVSVFAMNMDTKEKPANTQMGDRDFTVYDVIGAILDEISWHGDPAEGRAAKKLAEMDQAIEGIKRGEVEFVELDLSDDQPQEPHP